MPALLIEDTQELLFFLPSAHGSAHGQVQLCLCLLGTATEVVLDKTLFLSKLAGNILVYLQMRGM